MEPILIYVKNRQCFDGLLRVLEQLEMRGQTRISLTTDDKAVKSFIQHFRDDLRLRFISMRVASEYRWAAIVSTHLPPKNASLHGPLMVIPHGTGFGISGAYDQVLANNCDVYFGHSPGELDYFKEHSGGDFPDDRFVATGSPKTDDLAHYVGMEDADRRELKQALGLDPDLRVILVTSHWTPDSVLRTWGQDVLRALEPLSEVNNVVQIAHPGIWDYPAYDTYRPGKDLYKEPKVFDSKTLFENISAYCKNRKQVHFLPNLSAAQAIAVADLLIGDYSSIIIEYCLMDRPIVFTDRREGFFLEINYERYAAACGAARSLQQLATEVTEEMNSPERRSEARQALAGEFNWNLGNAASAIADEILERT